MDTHENRHLRDRSSLEGVNTSPVVFNFAQFFSSRISTLFAGLPNSGVSMAIGASFKQFEKSSGGACKSPLDYRRLSHNQAIEIDRLKQALFESKELAEIERIANLSAFHGDRNVRRLCAARIISSSHRTRFVQPNQTTYVLCSTASLARPQVPAAKEFQP